MKKMFLLCLVSTTVLSGCATTDGTNFAKETSVALFSGLVDNKCRTELNNQPIYQTVSMFITSEQKQTLENKVCGCVSQEASKNVEIEEIITTAFDKEAQAKLVTKAVGKTLKTCATQFINEWH